MVFLYASTIFLSAFLLFQVQPVIGKMILPWFGGSAAVWSTCMLVFQGLLLLGYLYAHVTTRHLNRKVQATLHISLLAVSVFLLPITPDLAWKPVGNEDPTALIIGLMIASVGLPYFLLSTTGPLVQVWFAMERPGSIPYRLFALSNLGSMLGLISYPLLFEPWLAIPRMSLSWSVAYAGFAFICGIIALRGFRIPVAGVQIRPTPTTKRPVASDMFIWAALAAFPSILLMAITSYLTQNIAPIPLLWVLPLVIYLASFILCFEGRGWYNRKLYFPIFIVFIFTMLYCFGSRFLVPHLVWSIVLFSVGLFLCCMVGHGELARLKPAASHLTSFYLMIAAGGAAGGVFVAVVAPRVFNDDYELSFSLIAMFVLVFTVIYKDPDGFKRRYRELWLKATVFTVTLLSVLTIAVIVAAAKNAIKMRNFYGTLAVSTIGEGNNQFKQMLHGVIMHGTQFLAPDRKSVPTAYYGTDSGAAAGVLLTRTRPTQRVGVVGLGVGTMASYCRPNDYYRFYEINVLVSELAKSQFTYLSDCQGTVEIVQGDARLSLERERNNDFDILLLDAFSGDSVPVHLLTQEAFAIYFRHIKDDGVLAVHVTNKHLNLVPIVKNAAEFYGKHIQVLHSPADLSKGAAASQWALISDKSLFLPSQGPNKIPDDLSQPAKVKPWTDDYSSIFGILK